VASEQDDYLNRQERKAIAKQIGAGHERLGVLNYSGQWESLSVTLPTYANHQELIQDPATGKFVTMTGIDGTPADPLGRT